MGDDDDWVGLLRSASDEMLDASMQPLIAKWSDPPRAIEILEVLDQCIHGSLAPGLVVTLLQSEYDRALRSEGATHESLLPLATWRDQRG